MSLKICKKNLSFDHNFRLFAIANEIENIENNNISILQQQGLCNLPYF